MSMQRNGYTRDRLDCGLAVWRTSAHWRPLMQGGEWMCGSGGSSSPKDVWPTSSYLGSAVRAPWYASPLGEMLRDVQLRWQDLSGKPGLLGEMLRVDREEVLLEVVEVVPPPLGEGRLVGGHQVLLELEPRLDLRLAAGRQVAQQRREPLAVGSDDLGARPSALAAPLAAAAARRRAVRRRVGAEVRRELLRQPQSRRWHWRQAERRVIVRELVVVGAPDGEWDRRGGAGELTEKEPGRSRAGRRRASGAATERMRVGEGQCRGVAQGVSKGGVGGRGKGRRRRLVRLEGAAVGGVRRAYCFESSASNAAAARWPSSLPTSALARASPAREAPSLPGAPVGAGSSSKRFIRAPDVPPKSFDGVARSVDSSCCTRSVGPRDCSLLQPSGAWHKGRGVGEQGRGRGPCLSGSPRNARPPSRTLMVGLGTFPVGVEGVDVAVASGSGGGGGSCLARSRRVELRDSKGLGRRRRWLDTHTPVAVPSALQAMCRAWHTRVCLHHSGRGERMIMEIS